MGRVGWEGEIRGCIISERGRMEDDEVVLF